MKTMAITREQNGGVTFAISGATPRTITNPNDLVIKALPDGTGVIIKVSDESFRQTVLLEDTVTINGDPAPIDLGDLIIVLTNNVFAGSTTAATPTKIDQTITFDGPADGSHTDDPFELVSSSSSGLPVTYVSSDDAVFTISGTTLTPVGAGTANITASAAGNNIYNAADDVVRPLTLS